MRAHVISLAWGLVVGAAVIDSGLKFDTRLFAPDFWDPTTLRQFSSDFVMSPTYFLASVMLVMFWVILLDEDDSYDLDDVDSLTLSPLSLLRQSILFMSGRSRGRDGVQPGSNVVADIEFLPPPPPSRPRTRSHGGGDGYMHEEVDIAPDGENGNGYGTDEEPEPDVCPAQRNKKANKNKMVQEVQEAQQELQSQTQAFLFRFRS